MSELTVSFVSGQWDQSRSGEAGPLHYESGGGGGEVRGWLKGGEELSRTNEAWTSVTHALGGLFCAGLGPNEEGESVNGFGHIYPPQRPQPDGEELPVPTLGVHSADPSSDAVHYLLPHPFLHLCTENLTPFLALLPSKGLSGLSSLLAQPGIIFSWGFKTEGIEVIMPDALTGQSGQWRGWWEGIVELVPPNPERRGREFSLQSLFKKNIPLPFPEAEESVLRVIMPEESGTGLQVEHEPDTAELKWLDGRLRTVKEWDLVQTGLIGQDLKFWWDEDRFQYRKSSSDLHHKCHADRRDQLESSPILRSAFHGLLFSPTPLMACLQLQYETKGMSRARPSTASYGHGGSRDGCMRFKCETQNSSAEVS